MSASIADAEWLSWPETYALTQAFAGTKAELRFVGGCVRDSLIGREVREVDAATPLTPDAVTALLAKAGIRTIPTGIEHGTVTAVVEERTFEITTLRRDTACDGRHAEVEYTTSWKEDAARRDFTINALYADANGKVYDYAGGLEHIDPLRLMFIGDATARIREDALRMLRFFRFSAQLRLEELDAEGLSACEKNSTLLEHLSGERIAQEMLKLLSPPSLHFSLLTLMHEAGLTASLKLPAPPEALEKLIAIEEEEQISAQPLRRLSVWLADVPPQALAERWRLSNAQLAYLSEMHSLRAVISLRMNEKAQKKLLRQTGKVMFTDAVLMAWAKDIEHAEEFREMLKFAKVWSAPVFPVKGKDLIAKGFASGKELGEILKTLEDTWEQSEYALKKDALIKMAQERKTGHG